MPKWGKEIDVCTQHLKHGDGHWWDASAARPLTLSVSKGAA